MRIFIAVAVLAAAATTAPAQPKAPPVTVDDRLTALEMKAIDFERRIKQLEASVARTAPQPQVVKAEPFIVPDPAIPQPVATFAVGSYAAGDGCANGQCVTQTTSRRRLGSRLVFGWRR